MSGKLVTQLLSVTEEFLQERDGHAPVLNAHDNLFELGHLDSNEFFDLISVIEDKLHVDFDFINADPADLVSIGGLARHLIKHNPACASW